MQRREAIKVIMTMLGTALSPSLQAALASGENRPAMGKFNEYQRQQITLMSERIIPTTDTPGAIAAGVPEFIERMVFQWYTETERSIFLHGLGLSDSYSKQQLGRAFVDLNPEQQDVVLQQMEIQGGAKPLFSAISIEPNYDEDKSSFFPKLKELVVVGYYTSEIGATEELRYEMMPMKYEGDIPLEEVGRSWATSGFLD